MRSPVPAMLAIGLIAACSMPTSVCGCSPPPPASAVVYGTILTAADSVVRGAVLRAAISHGTCPGTGQPFVADFGTAPIDATGRYRFEVSWGVPTDTTCVRVTARRLLAGATDSVVAAPVSLAMRFERPLDSTRVDIRFP